MDDFVPAAAELAGRYLNVPVLGTRWAHVQSVAARATELAPAVVAEDQDVLVAAAWLHDVGYAPELAQVGFHPLDGARYLAELGWPARIVALVAHHSGARYEAAERGLTAELEGYELEDSPVMDALVTADLTTGPAGERLTYTDRLDEILGRYPSDSPVHRAMSRARPALVVHIHRTAARLDHPM